MKKYLLILAGLLIATIGCAQPTPAGGPPAASQAEVNAGTVANKYVSPLTLDNWSGGGGGSGTVTSVSFTGGLISVGDPTAAAALTVAGTSGGIPYFSSASTWATSAALAANSLVIGGGAGVAPSTTTTGAGILTFLGTPSSANLAAAVTGETGSGALVFATSPALVTPDIGAATGTSLVVTGALTSGSGGGVSGAFTSTEGTAPSLTANAFSIYSPTDVAAGGLAYVLPAAASSGVLQATNAAGVMTVSHSALTSGRVTFATTNGLLLDDADMTFATDTLTTTNHVVTTNFDVVTTGVRQTGSNGSITFLGLGNGTDEDLKIDLNSANVATVTSSTGVVTLALGAIGVTTTGTNSIGPLVDSVDGTTPLNNLLSAYGAGTAYSFTNAAAAIDFGTTDPSITLTNAGTYTIYAQVHVAYAAATVVAETATITVRRTNNTAADLGQALVIDLPVATTLTNSYGTVTLPPFSYTTANTNDILTMNANVSATLGAGTINATAVGTSIIAIRRY